MLLTDNRGIDPWSQLRSLEFRTLAEEVIQNSIPTKDKITEITFLRTAHYIAYRVKAGDKNWLARIGVATKHDSNVIHNCGPFGTALSVPVGQQREFDIAVQLSNQGVSVAVPEHYERFENFVSTGFGLDVMWVPFLADSGQSLTAEQWAETLNPLHFADIPNLPVFTNRAKTHDRLARWDDRDFASELSDDYDTALQKLMSAATRWSPVHGDAHCGNVLISNERPVLYDFDTVCYAPTVWDLTHLLTRVGTDRNTGYTSQELIKAFDFTTQEINAAVRLRKIASQIARA